jgi:hypothetical protein
MALLLVGRRTHPEHHRHLAPGGHGPGERFSTLAEFPARLYHLLRANAEFRLRFADHVQRHCYNGGALTRAANESAVDRTSQAISPRGARARERALGRQLPALHVAILSSPPWPQRFGTAPLTRSNVVEEQARLFTQVFPTRTEVFVQQCRANGLYPAVEAPVFTQHGGNVNNGFALRLTNLNAGGVVYFTTDGSDPRLWGGAPQPGAQTAAGRSS